jgi:uncharacterized RDD family membrane protein YckC
MDQQPPPAPDPVEGPPPRAPGSDTTPPPSASPVPPAPAPLPSMPASAQPWQAPPSEAGPAPGVLFASPVSRLVAYILDSILLGVVIVILSVVLVGFLAAGSAGTDTMSGAQVGTTFIWLFVVLLVSLLYFPWFWARGGQTPGMKLLHIRVVRDADGGPIGWGTAMMRLLGYWINGIVLYIGFAWILVDKRRRGWHDLIANTVVIEVPRG